MAIKGQPFSLNATSNPSFTLSAGNIDLNFFAAIVIANRGPGAVGVYPSGSASGPPVEIVGAYQRKYIMLGGVDTICMAMIQPMNSIGGAFYQNTLYATLAACDDYSLSGTPDYARGAFGVLEWITTSIPVFQSEIQATDFGFDRIRGIFIPAQATPPEVFMQGGQAFHPIISESGMSITMEVADIWVSLPVVSTLMLSDRPIVAGGAGGGTYG
jgi:hypothetical protein